MHYVLTPAGDPPSEVLRDLSISAPEQFLAVVSMFMAAAEMDHTAERWDNDGSDLGMTLTVAALKVRAAARELLAKISPDVDVYRAVLGELLGATAV